MRYLVLLLALLMGGINCFAQVEKLNSSVISVEDDLVVVGISSKTTDEQLLDLRNKLLRYTGIRFTNFDVIREKVEAKGFFKKVKEGKIQFVSMAVDCRDGYQGYISHSFEKGDTCVIGFYRDYSKNTYKKPFFIGNLSEETKELKDENNSLSSQGIKK